MKFHAALDLCSAIVDYEKFCTIRTDLIQKRVNELYASSCLRGLAFESYAFCDQYPNGTYCSFIIGELEMRDNVRRHCSLMTDCTSNCRDALISAKKTHGCCVNSFIYSGYTPDICETKMDLWSHCGIESPGFCNNQLVFGSGKTSLSCMCDGIASSLSTDRYCYDLNLQIIAS